MKPNINNLMLNLDKYKFNPSQIQRVVLQHLNDITDGTIDIVDPTNPFVFLLESACVNTSNFLVQNEINTRKQYPAAAQTPEDVYVHMSDVDFVDRFAVPARTTFNILFNKEELIESLVFDPVTNSRKLIIPRNTEFTVADTTFSMQYPVIVQQLSHGGLQIVYDTETLSPLYDIPSNIVNWSLRTDTQSRVEWLFMEVDVQQFKTETYINDVTPSTGFNKQFSFDDSFYYARVYNKSIDTNNEWVEITTTHTDQVYDINTPTALLKVVDDQLYVSIPQVYLNTQKIRGSIRTDIYQTKGAINLILRNYKESAFSTEWKNIDESEDNVYSSIIQGLRTVFAYSGKTVNGGRDGLTFEELRKRVINNSVGPQQLPITNVQLESFLSNRGYTVVKNVDVVTNRLMLASRSMPKPIDDKLITSGNSSIETFISSVNSLASHTSVYNNGDRVTVPSDLVFKNNNGVISLLSAEQQIELFAKNDQQLVEDVNSNKYLYNPFHYVLDSSKNEFELRSYYLNAPTIKSISFVSQNNATNLQINTSDISIVKETNGYKIVVKTICNDAVLSLADDFIDAQLSFIPTDARTRCSINATVSRSPINELVFEFFLLTNYDIDEDNKILFNSFQFYDLNNRVAKIGLNAKFDLTFSIKNKLDVNWNNSAVDEFVNTATVGVDSFGLNHEVVNVEFGKHLRDLWSRSRSVFQDAPYRTHTSDSVKLYEEDVYAIDPLTSAIFSFDDDGNIVYNKLHNFGDIVEDENGNPIYNHRAGDLMLDTVGNPIPIDPANVVRQMDFLFIDGVYFIANDVSAARYRQQMIDSIVEWVVVELVDLNTRALEQTRIYFYPKTNLGDISVLVDNSVVTNIDANQVFAIQLYVDNKVFLNTDLRKFLTVATVKKIDTLLGEENLSISKFITNLKAIYGNDVISISLSGLGGNKLSQTISILNDGDRCSIKKKLVALPNGDRIVEEDVNIAFIKHEKTN